MINPPEAPLDDILRVRDPSPAVRLFQHARRLEIAREQNNIDAAIHELNLMLRIFHEHFKAPLAEGRSVRGFLPVEGQRPGADRAASES
jgi:hypothetical protein